MGDTAPGWPHIGELAEGHTRHLFTEGWADSYATVTHSTGYNTQYEAYAICRNTP